MTDKNYYDILGLQKDATQEEVKKAYHKLSLKFHPDKNNGDAFLEGMFKNINEANEILSDVSKRKSFDLSLKNNQTINKSDNYSNSTTQKGVDYKKINSLTKIYFEKQNLAKQRKINFQKANNIPVPNNITIPKILWMILIVLGSYFVLKPEIGIIETNQNNSEYVTTRQTNVYEIPDIKSKVIGYFEFGTKLNSLEETNYFIKIEFVNENGITSTGYVRKKNLN